MIATNDASPHESEYLAAARGMHEHTHSQPVYAIGDYVSGKYPDGSRWSGRVIWIDSDGMLAVESKGAWHRHWPKDVTH